MVVKKGVLKILLKVIIETLLLLLLLIWALSRLKLVVIKQKAKIKQNITKHVACTSILHEFENKHQHFYCLSILYCRVAKYSCLCFSHETRNKNLYYLNILKSVQKYRWCHAGDLLKLTSSLNKGSLELWISDMQCSHVTSLQARDSQLKSPVGSRTCDLC